MDTDHDYVIKVYDNRDPDDIPSLQIPMNKICFHKIELKHNAFVWIVGPKPYRPDRGSRGTQYLFVFDHENDVKELSLELIRINQTPMNYDYYKNKITNNDFGFGEISSPYLSGNDDEFRQSDKLTMRGVQASNVTARFDPDMTDRKTTSNYLFITHRSSTIF